MQTVQQEFEHHLHGSQVDLNPMLQPGGIRPKKLTKSKHNPSTHGLGITRQ